MYYLNIYRCSLLKMDYFLKNKFSEKYENIKEIGNGTYGSVFKIRNTISKKIYACKKILIENEIIYCVYNELIAWKTFDHPNIIKIIDICTDELDDDKYTCHIIMEKCDTSLSDVVLQKCILNHEQKMLYIEQIILALIYMWGKGYVHNDLSLSNILLKKNSIKIIDFGFMYNKYSKQTTYHIITQYIQPPELVTGIPSNCHIDKIDTWSLGQIIFALYYNDILLRWTTKHHYYLDLISRIAKPSVKIIRKYRLEKKYMTIYYNLISKQKCPNDYSINDVTLSGYMSELISYTKKNYPFGEYLSEKNKPNKFIKKLLNWSSNRRPNIIETCNIYLKIFPERNYIVKHILPDFKLEIRPVKINYMIGDSCRSLWVSLLDYIYLFKTNSMFKVHFNLNILNNNKKFYDLNVKTVHLMSQLWCNIYQYSNIEQIIHKLIYQPDECYSLTNIEKIENNFDRFYSFTDIIYHHRNKFNRWVLSEKFINVTELHKLQYYFMNGIGFNIDFFDAWDFFTYKKTNSNIEPYFKFLYYLYLSSPLISTIENKHIHSAIMLLIIAYQDNNVKDMVTNQFLDINEILKFVIGISRHIPKCLMSHTYNIGYKLICYNKNIDLSLITVDSYIIAYHLLWVIKQLSINNDLSNSNKFFGTGKKFTNYLQNYFDIISVYV
jgi:serine/threonine protein kinase